MKAKELFSARNLVYLAVLLALVTVLQTVGGAIKVGPTSLSFVLVPIVLGAVLIGWWAGAVLGFAFGFIVLMYGVTGADAFTNILFTAHPVLTTLTCLIKGVAAGLVPGLIYPLIAKKNKLVGVIAASALAPIMNTGLFIIGALTMSGTISGFVAEGSTIVYFLFIGCAGINFLIEFAINLVLSPAIHRVVIVVEKEVGKKKAVPVKAEETPEPQPETVPESERSPQPNTLKEETSE